MPRSIVLLSSQQANMYPSDWVEEVTLRDGSPVTVRPIRPEDAPLLQEAFKRLSLNSVYMRFLETFREMSDEQARGFATVNYKTHMAFVGAVNEEGQERLVFSARYGVPDPSHPGVAEAAIVVRDDYQGRGLGTIAMDRLLRYAMTQGIHTIQATVHISNARIMNFILKGGLPYEKELLEPGVWIVRMKLSDEASDDEASDDEAPAGEAPADEAPGSEA